MKADNNNNSKKDPVSRTALNALSETLYRHPLYTCLNPDDRTDEIRILVIGFNSYCRKFCDLCLQAGQMDGFSLHIDILSSDPEKEKIIYCDARPEIRHFVDIDGEWDVDDLPVHIQDAKNYLQPYGFLRIIPCSGQLDRLLEEFFSVSFGTTAYHYAFVGFNKGKENASIAKEIIRLTNSSSFPVCYIDKTTSRAVNPRLIPVDVDQGDTDIRNSYLNERAFCTHLSWKKELNFDLTEEYERFLDPKNDYNFQSSRAYVLSIGYKLYSVGIILRRECSFDSERQSRFVIAKDAEDASHLFYEKVLAHKDIVGSDSQKLFQKLVALEHRRWVLNYVTDGWRAPVLDSECLTDFDCIDTGKISYTALVKCIERETIKDEDNCVHPCLVHSTPYMPLNSEEWSLHTPAGLSRWNGMDTSRDSELDPLDRMSVDLHRLLQEVSDKRCAQDPLKGEEVASIEQSIADCDEDIRLAFRKFLFCLSNIVIHEKSYTLQYDTYKKAFTSRLKYFPDSNLETDQARQSGLSQDEIDRGELIAAELCKIDQIFFPVREANLYRNYKNYDMDLIENLPAILTRKIRPSIALGFEDGRLLGGRNEAVFTNVASATVLSPSQILYLYNYDTYSSVGQFTAKLISTCMYLEKRNIRCTVSFVLSLPGPLGKDQWKDLKDAVCKIRNEFPEYSQNKGNHVCFDKLSYKICTTDQEAAEFFKNKLQGCHIDIFDGSSSVFHSARENALFLRTLGTSFPYCEFDWRRKMFTTHEGCEWLQYVHDGSFLRIDDMFGLMDADINFEHFENSTHFPVFDEDFERLWKLYLGDYCGSYETGAENWALLCDALNNKVDGITVEDEILVKVPRKPHCINNYDRNCVRQYKENKEEYDKKEKTFDSCKQLLRALQDTKFIIPLDRDTFYVDDGSNGKKILKASFKFKSDEVRELFRNKGNILEVYSYYSTLKTGFFDDIACSYKFRLNETKVDNELDLVMTKGFHSIIVECKARKNLDQDFYHKLLSISAQFGIGCTPVLAGYTYSQQGISAATQADSPSSNDIQRTRGEHMGIITVSEENDITNIGSFLQNLMLSAK